MGSFSDGLSLVYFTIFKSTIEGSILGSLKCIIYLRPPAKGAAPYDIKLINQGRLGVIQLHIHVTSSR